MSTGRNQSFCRDFEPPDTRARGPRLRAGMTSLRPSRNHYAQKDHGRDDECQAQWDRDEIVHEVFYSAGLSNWIRTISDLVPTRRGGPQVPAPLLVTTNILPSQLSP